ncbi:MAG: glycosyltransferase [Desulfitobacteriaceae bacterium]
MLFIVLPAYNEEQALPVLLKDIEKACAGLPYQIVVVDDGSEDRTLEKARQFANASSQIRLIQHEQNKGLGRALWSGFQYVLEGRTGRVDAEDTPSQEWPDVVFTMDADNTHPPSSIPLLYARIRGGDDLVIASRYAQGGRQIGLSAWRRFLSWGAGKVMHFFFPLLGVQDYSSGYRAYRLTILRDGINFYGEKLIESRNFAAMVELLLKLAPFCRSFSEVPLELHYERKQGVSKMKIWATILGYVALIIHLKRAAWNGVEWTEEWIK